MQFKVFTYPAAVYEGQMDDLNVFLRSHKVVDVKKEVVTVDGNACWTFCVTYLLDGRVVDTTKSATGTNEKVDYATVLSPEDFAKFSLFRKIRKQIATNEGLPPFTIFSDAQLAELSKMPELSVAAVSKIPGVGQKRAEKFIPIFMEAPKLEPDGGEDKPAADEGSKTAPSQKLPF